LRSAPSAKTYIDLSDEPFELPGFTVRSVRLRHPQGVAAYRLDHETGSVVFATDVESGDPEYDGVFRSLIDGVDILIHDAQYTPEEYEQRRGRGHSSWTNAVKLASECQVGRLILFHHDPDRSDDELEVIVEQAREIFPHVEAAREGSSLLL
jgi:ribonuclease BN (tRNA processing enzyme)